MKIAVVTDDHLTISAHFGWAVFYEVFTVSDGKVTAHETLPKPAHGSFAHGPGHDHGQMLAPILDCQVLLAGGMGQGAHISLTQAGIQPILTDIRGIEEAIKAYLAGQLTEHPERLH
jgi:predicted Fe-Mo cluster-binding NifX family protein